MAPTLNYPMGQKFVGGNRAVVRSGFFYPVINAEITAEMTLPWGSISFASLLSSFLFFMRLTKGSGNAPRLHRIASQFLSTVSLWTAREYKASAV